MRKLLLLSVVVFGGAVSVIPGLAGAQGATPEVTAHDYYFEAPDGSRTPASVSIVAGGAVSFAYSSGASRHDVHFTAGPAAPTCTGATTASQAAFDSPGHTATPEGPGWSGSCTFNTAGDYSFLCTIHPSLMYGVVHVAAPASGPPTTSAGPAVSRVVVPSTQRGRAVSGSVTLGYDGSQLTVDVYAGRSLLASAHSELVGHSAGGGLSAGRHSFRVPLNATARRALRRRHELALKVKLYVTAPSQAATVVTRRVKLKS